MNKKGEFQQVGRVQPPVPVRVRRTGRPSARDTRSRAVAAPRNGPLSKEASRLLCAISTVGAEASLDPTDDRFVLVRKRRGEVSLGGGRFFLAQRQNRARISSCP